MTVAGRTIGLREIFATLLGVTEDRKAELYTELSASATLLDPSYWLGILFAAGIATLGLVLNSPAVIIGAMLISPLMASILSGGLALASGDMVLGARAFVNLLLSCLMAVGFAFVLVAVLPFKEITNEIAARTRPTTLDLAIAVFSGAIGSIATSKESKGVVTSIPGVAVAVALMPPLSVVGFGLAIAFGGTGEHGLQVAAGGGLLFLTNLVGITFTAMVVFLLLHIDTRRVREMAQEWRGTDTESIWFHRLLDRFPGIHRLEASRGLFARLVLILIAVLLILIPLSRSLSELKQELVAQQHENRVRSDASKLWEESFARSADGKVRSYIDRISVESEPGKLTLLLRVFTTKPLSPEEKTEYSRSIAASLGVPPSSLAVQLVEIPTTTAELAGRTKEEKAVPPPPTFVELQERFLQAFQVAMRGFEVPSPARLIGSTVTAGAAGPDIVTINYLSDRDISGDAQTLITADVRSRLGEPDAVVNFQRVPEDLGELSFRRNSAELSKEAQTRLDQATDILKAQPGLTLLISASSSQREKENVAQDRAAAVQAYLSQQKTLPATRFEASTAPGSGTRVSLALKISAH